MAGRLIPILVAGISGVAIGVATFGGELKEQQKKRVEEEFRRDIAAAAARGEDVSGLVAEATARRRALENAHESQNAHPVTEDSLSTRLSRALGLWAWKKSSPRPTVIKEAEQTSDQSKDQ